MEVALIIGFVLIVIIASAGAGKSKREDEYFPRKTILSAPEQVLYLRMKEALPENVVLAQVGLSRVIGTKKGSSAGAHLKISQKSVDFVVCDKSTRTIAVIELDDSSHEAEHRKKADAVKDKALASAGIKVIRWNVKNMPSVEVIKRTIHPPPASSLEQGRPSTAQTVTLPDSSAARDS